MNEKAQKIKADAAVPAKHISNDVELVKRLELIYERYGKDLPAFFRDVYKEAASKRHKLPDISANLYTL